MNSIPSVEVDSSDHVAKTTKTTCPYCGVGCGVSVNVQQNLKDLWCKLRGC